MFFWGIILMVGGALAALISFLSNLNVFADIAALGFGKWINVFFLPQYLTGEKIAFFIGALLVLVGIVLFFVGKARMKKAGADASEQKSVKFFRDLKGEFRKITWPTKKATARNTAVTLVMCAIMGIIICLIDLGLGQLIKLMLKLG